MLLNRDWEFSFEIKIAVQRNSVHELVIDIG
jgi:hypothetical protein